MWRIWILQERCRKDIKCWNNWFLSRKISMEAIYIMQIYKGWLWKRREFYFYDLGGWGKEWGLYGCRAVQVKYWEKLLMPASKLRERFSQEAVEFLSLKVLSSEFNDELVSGCFTQCFCSSKRYSSVFEY